MTPKINLLPFDKNPKCVKCLSTSIRRTYYEYAHIRGNGPCQIGALSCPNKEHLHNWCAICGFMWKSEISSGELNGKY